MTVVNVVGIGTNAADKVNNALWDANSNPPSKGSMLPKNKTAVEMISILTAVKGVRKRT